MPLSGVEWLFWCSLRYTNYAYCYIRENQCFTPDYQQVAKT
nr:MAG TPA: hypothetical protein [Caudoviricetes sp.]